MAYCAGFMPLGSTHDRITLWTAPGVTLAAGLLGNSAAVALAVGSAYLFSGLMFSGDLDTDSRQYRRWLFLRWIWLPYRRWLHHRSFWSHGPIVGTALRLLYLGLWVAGAGLAAAWLGSRLGWWQWQPDIWRDNLWQGLHAHAEMLLWVGMGLELGSMNHSLSDCLVSRWRRWRRRRRRRGSPLTRYGQKLG
ncbi:metal-binding protein [Synechococcus sp. H60.3]|uniref:metal-binding protein n=2 Tax=unclassified Synechococcus TaxID=2626047 RepID=UPI0039C38676